MKEKTKYRIGFGMTIVLILIAVIADLLGLIPLVKDVTATLYWIAASLYFWKKGMGLFGGKKLAAMSISWVSSIIPVLQEIPCEVTAGIMAILLITRIEDKTGLSITKPMKAGVTPPRLTRNPLNGQRGVRLKNKNSKTTVEEYDAEDEDFGLAI